MLNEEERRTRASLLEDAIGPLAAVLKCIAGLLALIVVAAGPWAVLTAGGPSSAGAHPASPPVDQAVAESRRVFEERRRAYDTARQSHAASPSNAMAGRWLAVK